MSEPSTTLILKLNAAGDVLRTTPLLRRLPGEVTWVTARANVPLLRDVGDRVEVLPWNERHRLRGRSFDLVVNLEDDAEVAALAREVRASRYFGALLKDDGSLGYTDDSHGWFDLGLLSRYGRAGADRLKLLNRRSYQDLLFEGLGLRFDDERYLLPAVPESPLQGDIAIAPRSGPVWPMKYWAGYDTLRKRLEYDGFTVNVLPMRTTLQEHVADVRNHRCLVSGDSLPMHIALGAGVRCVSLFTCTSPWEIHGYGLQTKVISPLLPEFFYQRGFDPRATQAISVEEVLAATRRAMQADAADDDQADPLADSLARTRTLAAAPKQGDGLLAAPFTD